MKNTESELGKTLEEWEAEEAAERKTLKGKIKYAWRDYLYYPVYRFVHRIGDIPNNIKDFYFRGKRGYATSDAWGIDSYLSSFMPELLRTMINQRNHGGNSWPGHDDDPNCDTVEHWHATVEKIAKGFEAARQQDDITYTNIKDFKKEWNRLEKIRRDGMTLFIEYYNHLWD
jgi:hypothetical protein